MQTIRDLEAGAMMGDAMLGQSGVVRLVTLEFGNPVI
jgi:hypothetical protein